MYEYEYERLSKTNIEILDAALKLQNPDVIGIKSRDNNRFITIITTVELNAEQENTLRNLVDTHDPKPVTQEDKSRDREKEILSLDELNLDNLKLAVLEMILSSGIDAPVCNRIRSEIQKIDARRNI